MVRRRVFCFILKMQMYMLSNIEVWGLFFLKKINDYREYFGLYSLCLKRKEIEMDFPFIKREKLSKLRWRKINCTWYFLFSSFDYWRSNSSMWVSACHTWLAHASLVQSTFFISAHGWMVGSHWSKRKGNICIHKIK